MNYPIEIGGAVLSIAGSIKHLHFVCCEPFFDRKRGDWSVVAVNVSSVKSHNNYDPTCILDVGDHPFIRHKSFVYYRHAAIFKVSYIKQGIATGDIILQEKASDRLMSAILAGFAQSEQTSAHILALLNQAK